MRREPMISVVIPTWRRPDLLARCLTALQAQTLPEDLYEIIVCDDGPDTATREQVQALSQQAGPQIRYVPVTQTQGPASARNVGWRLSQAPYIAFTDDDTVPDRLWLEEALIAIRSGEYGAVSGRIEMPLPPVPTDYELDASGLTRAEFATANVIIKRNVLEAVGGFDERFGAAWREDSDLQFSILALGERIGRSDRATVVHPLRPGYWGISVEQQKKIMFDALLYAKHPQLYRQRIRKAPPWLYYGIVAALLTVVLAPLLQNPFVTGFALAVWIILTGFFCLRRLAFTSHRWPHIAEMIWTSIAIPPVAVYWRLRGAVRFHVLFM